MKKITKLTSEVKVNMIKDENGFCWVERTGNPIAVTMLPLLKKGSREYFVFIKEFRPVVETYVYQFPAGCVPNNETPKETAIRELKEEIGAVTSQIHEVASGYTTIGLTNEYAIVFQANVDLIYDQDLKTGEDIIVELVERSKVKEFIDIHKHELCIRSALLALLYC